MNEYTYEIQFQAGNASGRPPSDIPALEGNTVVLPYPSGLTLDGYEFVYWTILNPEDGTVSGVYKSGEIYIMPGHDVIMVASFAFIYTYTIEYYIDGYNIPDNITYMSIDYPFQYTIPDTIPKKDATHEGTTNYVFIGYSDKFIVNDADELYQPGDTIDLFGKGITLYPRYQVRLSIKYDLVGADMVIEDDTIYNAGDMATVSNIIPSKLGYTFRHYTANPNPCETKNEFLPNDAFIFNKSHGIYFHAVYNINSYDIYYHFSDSNIVTITRNFNTTFEITPAIPTKTGYEFIGWYIEEEPDVIYKGGDLYTLKDNDVHFYPSFTERYYQISYDVGLGTTTLKPEQVKYNSEFKIPNEIPTISLSLLEFDHWIDSYGNKNYKPGDSFIMPANDVVFTAIYGDISRTVTFDINGGIGSTPPSQTIPKGEIFKLNEGVDINSFARRGYSFLGWSTDQHATIAEYLFLGECVLVDNMTLYAVWKRNTYRVYYNKNTMDVVEDMPGIQTALFEDSITISLELPYKVNADSEYIFLGWNTDQHAIDAKYSPGSAYTIPPEDTILFAIWRQKAYDFTLEFDGNGIGYPPDLTYQGTRPTHEFIIPNIIPVWNDMLFIGWDMDVNIKEPRYKPGIGITINSGSTILHSFWKSTHTYRYEIIFDPLSGNGGPGTIVHISESPDVFEYIIPSDIPILRDHQFKGWMYDNKFYQPDDIVRLEEPSTITLEAVYIQIERDFNLILNMNDGTNHTTQLHYNGRVETYAFTIPDFIPTRKGYTFYLGWSEHPDGTGHIAVVGGKTREYTPGTYTLYANWMISYYTIQYDIGADATNKPASIRAPYLSSIIVTNDIPLREGYIFKEWVDNASGLHYNAGSSITLYDNDIILTATWVENSFHVLFDTMGGSTSIASLSGKYNQVLRIPDTTIDKPGFSFLGWSKNKNSSVADYKPGSTIVIDEPEDIILYAIFTSSFLKLSYILNGGKFGPPSQQGYNYQSTIVSDTIPFKRNYKFLGWSDNRYVDKVVYKPGDTIQFKEQDINLYAIWEMKPRFFMSLRKINGKWRRLPFWQ